MQMTFDLWSEQPVTYEKNINYNNGGALTFEWKRYLFQVQTAVLGLVLFHLP